MRGCNTVGLSFGLHVCGDGPFVGCCIKAPALVEVERNERKLFDCAAGQSFPSSRARGRTIRWCTMREEFASNSFLAVTVAGLVLLCSGLIAFAFT
jgi:hypothetical protein